MALKAQYRDEFKLAIKEAAGELSIPKIAYKTNISYETIRKMVSFGHVPSEEMLVKLAEGLNADLHKLRVAAGYEQDEPELKESVSQILKRIQLSGGEHPIAKEDVKRIALELISEVLGEE